MEILVLAILFLELLIYVIYKKSSLILSSKDMFPKIDAALIEKFNSYDKKLGWCNQKNSIKVEPSQGKEITYTYNHLGARSLGSIDADKSDISTYGDSYCLAREVNDSATWQYFLSEKLDSNVLNFGVGNYGLDQSLLRLKREYKNNPTNIVIMAITPYTITRITSVWKHFSEFGNVLATKPRYISSSNNLKLIPNFLQDKNDLLNMNKFENFLLENDEHVKYFKKHIYRFPFIFSFFKKPKPLLKTVLGKCISLFKRLKLKNIVEFLAIQYYNDEILYRKELYSKQAKLLNLIIKDFIEFSNEKKFIPILLILPTLEDITYIQKTNDIYYEKYFNINDDKLTYWDFTEILKDKENPGKLFIDKIWGGPLQCRWQYEVS